MVDVVVLDSVVDGDNCRNLGGGEVHGEEANKDDGVKVSVVDDSGGRITINLNVSVMLASQSNRNGKCLRKSSSAGYQNFPSSLWKVRMCMSLYVL